MAECGNRVYEGVNVEGHTKLHQGDKYTALNIGPGNTINISVQGNLEWTRNKRKCLHEELEHTSENSCAKRQKYDKSGRCEVPPTRALEYHAPNSATSPSIEQLESESLQQESIAIVNEILHNSGSDENVSSVQEYKDEETSLAFENVRSTLRDASSAERSFLINMIDRIRQNSLFPAITKVFPNPSSQVQQDAIQDAMSVGGASNLPVYPGLNAPAQDLVCVFVAMLALLSCEKSQSHSAVSNSKHSLGKVSIAGLVTFAVARYFCLPQFVKQLSEWAGGSLIIQDPFLRDLRVPKAHIEHFTLLEAFLRFKLHGTTAEAFVQADQFNLTIGQRYGPTIRKSDWSSKGRIKCDQRLVMAVFIRKGDAKCLECNGPLTMSESGRFSCYPCGKVYGNCMSPKYSGSPIKRLGLSSRGTRLGPGVIETLTPRLVELDEDEQRLDDEAEDVYDLEGLENIDLQILRRKRTLPPDHNVSVNIPSALTTTYPEMLAVEEYAGNLHDLPKQLDGHVRKPPNESPDETTDLGISLNSATQGSTDTRRLSTSAKQTDGLQRNMRATNPRNDNSQPLRQSKTLSTPIVCAPPIHMSKPIEKTERPPEYRLSANQIVVTDNSLSKTKGSGADQIKISNSIPQERGRIPDCTHSEEAWERMKIPFYHFYIEKNLSLKESAQRMSETYGFQATLRQWERRMAPGGWGFTKYSTSRGSRLAALSFVRGTSADASRRGRSRSTVSNQNTFSNRRRRYRSNFI